MKDTVGKLLYIGKAANLKHVFQVILRSYDARIQSMVPNFQNRIQKLTAP